MPQIGKILVILGAVIIVIGLVVWFADKIPFLGKLPGDIVIKRENVRIYFPIATMIILSILLTILINLFRK